MTINRSIIRKQLALRLSTRLITLVDEVYNYQAGDFRGASPVVVVTNSSTRRANPLVANDTKMYLDIHTFVLYAIPPVQVTDDVDAGTDVVILLTDTSMFTVGQEVIIKDDDASEVCTITNVTDNVSITLDEVVNNYILAKIHVWTEEQSEDMLDLLEYEIADEVVDANDDDNWSQITTADQSTIDVVDIGGLGYRHEAILVEVTVQDY